ncbi:MULTISPECIES: uroporphyrinogen-III synthase [Rhizobium]|uniref:Uroporphyrinogen-III synthase n=1 Tax=Rhizobium favelukesii TaxID=348824 RepID=W6RGT6_9HYPH|nr:MULTISPECIES: uroporphyrinogen-III synthase [Rhizobium]MCA0803581.1 uroporphyrinogen-III synthase [Rhizobium sp. T1473]MCS0461649.1 uroporphyrinogen-III synthase [Rhizobium favelukesii]UFS82836.1 uroporphyrinogen-III synthase [Rhizobium sp. T136]CDM59570.1 uroporphyrinogen-III synthase [Rhizobium favelukesii]
MRVLVTRPQHSGERTAERLRELGHEPILLPLSQPVHDGDAAVRGLETTEGGIVITSAETIRALATHSAELAVHLTRPVFAVGDATAEEARTIGFTAVTASGGSGTELAETIAERAGGGFVLYLAGRPRAETFEKRAREIGLRITVVECYRMEPTWIAPQTLQTIVAHQRPDAILFFSRQTAENFFRVIEAHMSPDGLAGMRFLCLSKSVAEAVPIPLQGAVSIASVPEERSLLSLL